MAILALTFCFLLFNTAGTLLADDLALCRSDLNRNGEVDIFDVAEIAAIFGDASRYDPLLDLSENGEVDIFDVARLAQYFGQRPPQNRLVRFQICSAEDSLHLAETVVWTDTDTLATRRDRDGRLAVFLIGNSAGYVYFSHPAYVTKGARLDYTGADTTLQVYLNPDGNSLTACVIVRADSLLGSVSPWLTGFNTLYCHVTDSIRAEGRLAGYLRDVRSGILRFPGGEVSSQYHWEVPGYAPWTDGLPSNPTLNPALAPHRPEYMDTDENIAFCREVGAEPMIGVNLESWKKAGRVEDGIAEAVRWVQYCKDRQYNVRHWFMDNESNLPGTYHQLTVAEYADLIKRYVTAMRTVDPEIKIIINWETKPSTPLLLGGLGISVATCRAILGHCRYPPVLVLELGVLRPLAVDESHAFHQYDHDLCGGNPLVS